MEQSKFYQIKNITEHEYTLVSCDGSVITRPIQDVDKSASAFTIQDAKDGDVLMSRAPFIYGKPIPYGGLDWYNGKFIKASNYVFKDSPVHPATKEQRNLLFSKMKEAGYVFNFDKKELKKIESKFHVGDWVVYNYPNTLSPISEIVQIDKGVIDLKDTNGSRFQTNINELNCNYHLWNISDVKAGDILAADPIEGIEGCSFSSSFVAIYKKRNGEDFDSYCFVGFDGKFCKGTTGHSTDNIHPATKEQRGTLMKKMAKAGYTFDFEKKLLKKIEEKPAWKPSDEQINTLFKYAEQNNKDGSILTSLYQELKKLKNKENNNDRPIIRPT